MNFSSALTIIMEGCEYGKQKIDKCHKTSYVSEIGIRRIDELDDKTQEILKLRSGFNQLASICFHHEHIILQRFPKIQTKCCDPFDKHESSKSKKRKSSCKFFYSLAFLFYNMQLYLISF